MQKANPLLPALVRTAGWGLVFLLFFGAWGGVAAAGMVENLGPSSLDWQTRILWAAGKVSPQPALPDTDRNGDRVVKRRARLLARKALWQGLLKVRVHNRKTVADVIRNRPDTAQALRGLVHTSPIEPVTQDSGDPDRSVPLTYKAHLPLTGRTASLCIPSSLWYTHSGNDVYVANATMTNATVSKDFTGLIVDVRGLGGKPALVCRLFDEHGRLVYGPSFVSRHIGVNKGMAAYVTTPEEGLRSPRTGQRPCRVRALRRRKGSLTDFVLQNVDVAGFWTPKVYEILRQGRVVLVMQGEDSPQVVEYPLQQ